jgi:hypothetical protein
MFTRLTSHVQGGQDAFPTGLDEHGPMNTVNVAVPDKLVLAQVGPGTAVPELTTMLLMGVGLIGLARKSRPC